MREDEEQWISNRPQELEILINCNVYEYHSLSDEEIELNRFL